CAAIRGASGRHGDRAHPRHRSPAAHIGAAFMKIIPAIAMTILSSLPPSALAQAMPVITPEEWAAYAEHFVSPEGRVIDTANGNISHSEGQGYGLLLAVLADDRAAFERIWSFTRTELMIRPDGLAAWRWEPDTAPHVTDPNN